MGKHEDTLRKLNLEIAIETTKEIIRRKELVLSSYRDKLQRLKQLKKYYPVAEEKWNDPPY